MNVLQVKKQIKDSKFTYSLMTGGEREYIHINNHQDNQNAVIVPLSKITELLEK